MGYNLCDFVKHEISLGNKIFDNLYYVSYIGVALKHYAFGKYVF